MGDAKPPRAPKPKPKILLADIDLLPPRWGPEKVDPVERAIVDYVARLVEVAGDLGASKARTDLRCRQARWLALYAFTVNHRDAAKFAEVEPSTVSTWATQDPVFAQVRDEARLDVGRSIEAEMHRRAIEGVEEPVYQGGKLVGTVRKFSDQLLIRMAQAHLPAYRPGPQQATASDPTADAAARREQLLKISEDPELRAALEKIAAAGQ